MVTEEKRRQQLLDELEAMRQRLAEFKKQQMESQYFEERLRDNEEKYKALFNSGNDAMFVQCPTVEGRPGRFIEINDAACQMLGYTKEELRQFTPMDISPTKAWDMKPEEVIELLYEGKCIVIESEFTKRNGRRIPIEVSIRMFDFKGKPTILSIARDITERKKVEKTQRRHEQRIRKLAAACIQAQEQEREVIAMEVHDRNLQTMLSIYHQIEKLESLMEPGSKEQQLAVKTLNLIKQAVAETRNIMKDLYPETLAQFGLVSLIEEELRRFKMEMHCLGTLDICCSKRLPKDIETTLYRVFHEALLNIKRHAGEFKRVF
jgi:PAS domain S-box-containing protein